MKNFTLLPLFFLLSSCTGRRSDSYLFHDTTPLLEKHKESYTIGTTTVSTDIRILIVWDTSGSMNNKHEAITEFFYTFFNVFFKDSISNFMLGIVNTNASHPRMLIIKKEDIKKTSPLEQANKFKDTIVAMNNENQYGDNTERVFHNMLLFFDHNRSFFDPESTLSVIIVTDEEEQTTEEQLREFGICNDTSVCQGGEIANLILSKVYAPKEQGGYGKREDEVFFHLILDLETKHAFVPLAIHTKGVIHNVDHVGVESTFFTPSILKDVAMHTFSQILDTVAILDKKPLVNNCFQVHFKGNLVPSKDYWFYADKANAVIFHDLNFATGSNEITVDISYELQSDGISRGCL